MSKKPKRHPHNPDFIVSSRAEVVVVDVDNPFHDPAYSERGGNPKSIKAAVNMMESPAANWLHTDRIDEAQYRAATKFRRLWEMGGGAGAGAIDYAREPVDGGPTPDPISVQQVDALRQLKNVEAVLGPAGYILVRDVCGTCTPMKLLYDKRRERDLASSRCRDMLTVLAEFWGYKQRPTRAQRYG